VQNVVTSVHDAGITHVNCNEDHVSFDVVTSLQPALSSAPVAFSVIIARAIKHRRSSAYYAHVFSYMNPVTQNRCAALKLVLHSSLSCIQNKAGFVPRHTQQQKQQPR